MESKSTTSCLVGDIGTVILVEISASRMNEGKVRINFGPSAN